MNEMAAVTAMAVYLHEHIAGIAVFKYKKPTNYHGEYICVNSLPVTYGKTINDTGIVNVNVHIPDQEDESIDTIRLDEVASMVDALLPHENTDTEDSSELIIEKFGFTLLSGSNCIEDNDRTHFINFRIKYNFLDI